MELVQNMNENQLKAILKTQGAVMVIAGAGSGKTRVLTNRIAYLIAEKNVLESKKTVSAPIRSENPVFIYYVTSWVENGNIQALPDIYKYDGLMNFSGINWNVVKKYL